MIDLHCHLLYGIDDGAQDRETAAAMLRAAADDGIGDIVCTPHFSSCGAAAAAPLRETLAQEAAGLGIALHPGMEYDYRQLRLAESFQTLGNGRFLLLDFCAPTLPAGWETAFAELRLRGYEILVAHPERLFRSIDTVRRLRGAGAYFQLTAGSLLGDCGRACAGFALRLLYGGFCDCVASDAHGLRRTFHLSGCREMLERRLGAEETHRIFETNAAAILNGGKPERMEPVERNFRQRLRDRFGKI